MTTTKYFEANGMQQWEWSSRGLCGFCGTHKGDECPLRYCDSCSATWLSTPKELDEGQPVQEFCPDCLNSFCKAEGCGLPACHDVHDTYTGGAFKHAYDDGECRALVVFDPNFSRFDWTTIADREVEAFRREMRNLTRVFNEGAAIVRDAHSLLGRL